MGLHAAGNPPSLVCALIPGFKALLRAPDRSGAVGRSRSLALGGQAADTFAGSSHRGLAARTAKWPRREDRGVRQGLLGHLAETRPDISARKSGKGQPRRGERGQGWSGTGKEASRLRLWGQVAGGWQA